MGNKLTGNIDYTFSLGACSGKTCYQWIKNKDLS